MVKYLLCILLSCTAILDFHLVLVPTLKINNWILGTCTAVTFTDKECQSRQSMDQNHSSLLLWSKSKTKLGLILSTQGYIDVHCAVQECGPKSTALTVLGSATDIVFDLLQWLTPRVYSLQCKDSKAPEEIPFQKVLLEQGSPSQVHLNCEIKQQKKIPFVIIPLKVKSASQLPNTRKWLNCQSPCSASSDYQFFPPPYYP